MKIKNRLSLYFTLISLGALLACLVAVYIAVLSFSTADFYNRLTDRVDLAAKLYLKADELAPKTIELVQHQYLAKLPDEVLRVYDDNNLTAFKAQHNVYWRSEVIEQVRREKYIEYEDGRRKVVGKYYQDNQGNFVILASAIDDNSPRRMRRLGNISVLMFTIFSVVLFFAGRMFAQRALSPVNNVINQVRRIRATNLHLRVEQVKNRDEIAELIDNVNLLLEHLENAFELQQTFVANASHELRTPLTSIMGEVDVALSKPRDTQEYLRVLSSIAADGRQLQETITSLMQLAQVEAHYTRAALSPVRLDELVWELADIWTDKKGAGKLKVNLGVMPEDENALTVDANKQMLFIALNNIVDNAFKYSGDKPVTLNFTANGEILRLEVSDEGNGIAPEDANNIFKPFYRGNADRAINGSGIGLYITSKIVSLFKGTIQLKPNTPSGSTFTINFLRSSAGKEF
ncbi:sensor histidine kinase [Mucilaginibacter terrenus]|uniref:histidine kinase n=1 Tax=Mucilaginibacter terrenus TaxID=2482727 RepID=A0A3E2NJR9_9SPHI|nr:HAMP domain-containing sensor histidine kinase [Mucilaginibacter terrenus]RFZ81181.1 sensor histidine kinase [Mucilaginibacter terrenus]